MASRTPSLLKITNRGLYCPEGDFYIDPWKPVVRAVITHAHSDHARWGMGSYLCSTESERVMRIRLGSDARIKTVPYGEALSVNGVKLSLHPAGHILGSAQIRVEKDGFVAVVSGDYKTEPDATCTPFELLPCNLFVTESTFGLPIYRWCGEPELSPRSTNGGKGTRGQGRPRSSWATRLERLSVLWPDWIPISGKSFSMGQSTGSRKRLAKPASICRKRKPFTMSTANTLGLDHRLSPSQRGRDALAPPIWRYLRPAPFMSGWMAIRGARRRRAGAEWGFVMSDHVDWPSLMNVISATNAEHVWVTHGYSAVVVRYLQERGLDAKVMEKRAEGDTRMPGSKWQRTLPNERFRPPLCRYRRDRARPRKSSRHGTVLREPRLRRTPHGLLISLSAASQASCHKHEASDFGRLKKRAGIPEWLFFESYDAVGDLAETIAAILPDRDPTEDCMPSSQPSEDSESFDYWVRDVFPPRGHVG